jgi:hypothetical protein
MSQITWIDYATENDLSYYRDKNCKGYVEYCPSIKIHCCDTTTYNVIKTLAISLEKIKDECVSINNNGKFLVSMKINLYAA